MSQSINKKNDQYLKSLSAMLESSNILNLLYTILSYFSVFLWNLVLFWGPNLQCSRATLCAVFSSYSWQCTWKPVVRRLSPFLLHVNYVLQSFRFFSSFSFSYSYFWRRYQMLKGLYHDPSALIQALHMLAD